MTGPGGRIRGDAGDRGFDEALTRAVLYVSAADRVLDQRCALALNVARQQLMRLSLAEFKALVRDQFFVLQLEPERAIEVLAVTCAGVGRAEETAEAGARDRQRGRSPDRGRTRPPGPAVAGAGRADREAAGAPDLGPTDRR